LVFVYHSSFQKKKKIFLTMPVIRELTYTHVDKLIAVLTDAFTHEPIFHYFSDYRSDGSGRTQDIDTVRALTAIKFSATAREALLGGARVFAAVELDPENPELYDVQAVALWVPPGTPEPTFWSQMWSGKLLQPWRLTPEFQTRLEHEFVPLTTASKKRVFARMAAEGRLSSAATSVKSEPFPYWFLSFLAVRPDCQGRGLSRALLRYTLQLIDGQGYYALLESSSLDNAANVYVKHGFKEEDRVELDDGNIIVPIMVRAPKVDNYFKK
jgi:GNAT superfamily N-acetyltransferase